MYVHIYWYEKKRFLIINTHHSKSQGQLQQETSMTRKFDSTLNGADRNSPTNLALL